MGNCLNHQGQSQFPSQTTSDEFPAGRPLNPMAVIKSWILYHLHQPKKMQTKEMSAGRINLVISKQELKEILEKEGLTLEDMVPQIQKELRYCHKKEKERSVLWKPELESILEVNDLC